MSAPAEFGALLRGDRLRVALSQGRLARLAGVDPAYVSRLERGPIAPGNAPSRKVVLALAEAVDAGPEGTERLLCAAGLVPEVIVRAGGWDAYRERTRAHLDAAFRADPLDAETTTDDLPFIRRAS